MSRRIFMREPWYDRLNWGAIFAVAACLIAWAGFVYWIVGLAQ